MQGEDGTIGWIKPSEFDETLLKQQNDEELRKLFEKGQENK